MLKNRKNIEYCFINQEIRYDGSQLSSHYAYRHLGIAGNSIIAFIGPVEVKTNKMVDIEDQLNKQAIASDKMLNFIIEVFNTDLTAMIWMQRLLIAMIQEQINIKQGKYVITREGDDLYYHKRKLSVSIATVSPVSGLIHTGLNIIGTGAPIPIAYLEELSIEPVELAKKVLEHFAVEFEEVEFAKVKVRWVE